MGDMLLELNGKNYKSLFDINEIDSLYESLGLDREFLRNQLLGHTILDYNSWSVFDDKTGYSIWKIAPTNYTYNALNQLYFDDKILTNQGQATALTSAFDKVYVGSDESGETLTDNTTEAGTEGGTYFDLMSSTSDYLYLGLDSTFLGIKFEFATKGLNYNLVLEYYSSESGAWKELTSNDNNLVENTNNFASDGLISWDLPTDWVTTSINSVTKYWVRISTSTIPSTMATAYYIVPGNSVESLLALSSSEIIGEEWKWCYYNGYVYVTIKNSGQSAYEGNTYIKSSSSNTNKQNFFVYNHTFSSDYKDSSYVAYAVGTYFLYPVISKSETTPPESGLSNGDRYLIITADSGTEWVGHENEIATYDASEETWDYTSVVGGCLLFVTDEQLYYFFDGSIWKKTSEGISHDSLSNLDYASSGHTGFEPTVTKGNLTETTSSVLSISGGTNAIIGSGLTIEVNLATPSDGDATHLSSADQIYDFVTGLGYLTTESDTLNDVVGRGATTTTDITIGDILSIGDGTDIDTLIKAYNADANKPALKYDSATNKWQFSNDGVTFTDMGTGSGGALIDLTDVSIESGVIEDEILAYSGSGGLWINKDINSIITRTVAIKVIEDGITLTTGDGKIYFTVPEELDGMSLVTVGAHIYTTSSSGNPSIAIYNKTDSVDMLSTNITIDSTEYDSSTATTSAVINTSYDDVATGDEIRIDVDVAGTGTKGLEVRLGFKLI
jgi:hypothetical protein